MKPPKTKTLIWQAVVILLPIFVLAGLEKIAADVPLQDGDQIYVTPRLP